jgi:hypothetical protein
VIGAIAMLGGVLGDVLELDFFAVLFALAGASFAIIVGVAALFSKSESGKTRGITGMMVGFLAPIVTFATSIQLHGSQPWKI